MKARIPKHREFIIDFPKEVSQEKADEGWEKLTALLEDYKKAHNGQSVYYRDSSLPCLTNPSGAFTSSIR